MLKKFNNYTIEKLIKIGGMASIYKAKNITSNEIVALKVIHESFLDDQDLLDKFLYEAEILKRLNSKYPESEIVKCFDSGIDEETKRPFLVLEFIEGSDLDEILKKKGNLSVDEAIYYISRIANALSFCHLESIWHRDISPGNIMVLKDNTIKILDFGVAKHEYLGKKTPDGSLHGKPPYMSPEQCTNSPIDGRSDIYSLGILFYALLTGKPPFLDSNPLLVMKMHEEEKVPKLPDFVPVEVQRVIYKMLEKDPNNRYQNISELLNDLNNNQNTKSNKNYHFLIRENRYFDKKLKSKTLEKFIIFTIALLLIITVFIVLYESTSQSPIKSNYKSELEELREEGYRFKYIISYESNNSGIKLLKKDIDNKIAEIMIYVPN